MPEKRKKHNKGFPTGWRLLHGAIYYTVPKGKEKLWNGKKLFRLGKTTAEAYIAWAERVGRIEGEGNVGALLDRYLLEVTPTKTAKSQTNERMYAKKLRGVFWDTPLSGITPQVVYKYQDTRKAKVSGRREIALLSHALTKAIQWGYITTHPFKGDVRLETEKPRTRYIEDWELKECLLLPSMRTSGSVKAIQAYIRLKMLTGLRRGDLLRLREVQIEEDGIHVETAKTGKPIIYEWSEELRAAVELAREARPVDIGPYLFCNKLGECYYDEKTGNASGWESMWSRFMQRVLAETKLKERFTDHDLRAKVASDAGSLEHARQLLAHTDSAITNRIYRRKAEKVKPAK